jgi:hypothetical protein
MTEEATKSTTDDLFTVNGIAKVFDALADNLFHQKLILRVVSNNGGDWKC